MIMETIENQQLKISSRSENLALVENLISTVCDEHKVNEDHYGNILVAVTEAVTNAIQHGNKYDPKKMVNVSVESGIKCISFTIKDQGDGFDYNHLPDPTDPQNIEKPHGRGIFLMKHLADMVEFEEKGRVVRLKFNESSFAN